jgi:CubicO group peptidase (beta-lactamase class C family)
MRRDRTASIILAIGLVGAVTAVATAQGSEVAACPDGEAVACLAGSLATEAQADAFGGVIVIARDREAVLAEGYGLQPSGDPYEADTPFSIASLGKMFIGVAVAQLVEAGEVSLGDPAGTHVADLPAGVLDATVEQLLTHTSGLGDSIDEGIVGEPGTFRYTNAGFDVLARVIESASGQPLAQYLEEHVFEPAGMSDTFLPEAAPGEHPIGWGGEMSTGPDLLRFVDALFEGRLLGEAASDLVIAPHVETDHGTHYGYGFEIWGDPEHDSSVGHFGAADLFLGWVDSSESLGYTMIALCDRGCDAMGGPVIDFMQAVGLPG